MNFRCKMKFNFGVIISLRIQIPFALSEVNQISVFIFGNIRVFETDKIFQLFFVFTRYPASLIKWQTIKLYRCAVLMQQTVLNNFKLQFPHATDYFFIAAKLREQLSNSFV